MEISNALTGLVINPIPSNYVFNSARVIYDNLTLSHTTESITFTPTASCGVITVNGQVISSGQTSDAIAFNNEETKVITITNQEEGKDPRENIFTIKRRGLSRALSDVVVSDAPADYNYDPEIYTYNITVPNYTNPIRFTPSGESDEISINNMVVAEGAYAQYYSTISLY